MGEVSDLVERAATRGELAPGVDQRALADLLGAQFAGLARMAVATGDPMRFPAAVDVLVRCLDGTVLTGS